MWEGTLIRCCAVVMLFMSIHPADPVLAGTGIEPLQQWHAEQENENQGSNNFDTHGDHFGGTVALDGNFAIVGAQFNHIFRFGGVYVFRDVPGVDWARESLLTTNQGDYQREAYQEIGNAADILRVSESEAWAIVGATGFDNDGNTYGVDRWYSGQAFLMHLQSDTWTLQQTYKPWDGPAANSKYSHDNLGASVSLTSSGDTIISIVGATRAEAVPLSHPNTAPKFPFPGRAYLFFYTEFGNQPKFELAPPEDAPGENHYSNAHFGKSVDIDGTKAIVGADWAWNYQGRAYIYDCDNVDWDCFQPGMIDPIELPPPGSILSSQAYYGTSVAISSTGVEHGTAAVGAPGSNDYAGRAFAYERLELPGGDIAWEETELVPGLGADLVRRDRFGTSISISDDGKVIAVGAIGRNEGRGAVYVFKHLPDNDGNVTWQHVSVIQAGDSRRYDHFGSAISLSGNIDDCRLLVGAKLYDKTGKFDNNEQSPAIPANDLYLNAGCTYLFDISDDPAPPSGACCIDLFCLIRTQADCQGVYLGDGSNCNDDPCAPAPTGACCNGDLCQESTEIDCHGEYYGDDTDCNDVACGVSEPTGACDRECSCIVTTQSSCELSGSTYIGDDTNCEHDIACYWADLNHDRVVDVKDLLKVIDDWNCESNCPGDSNCDSSTDISDLLNIIGEWGCSF